MNSQHKINQKMIISNKAATQIQEVEGALGANGLIKLSFHAHLSSNLTLLLIMTGYLFVLKGL